MLHVYFNVIMAIRRKYLYWTRSVKITGALRLTCLISILLFPGDTVQIAESLGIRWTNRPFQEYKVLLQAAQGRYRGTRRKTLERYVTTINSHPTDLIVRDIIIRKASLRKNSDTRCHSHGYLIFIARCPKKYIQIRFAILRFITKVQI